MIKVNSVMEKSIPTDPTMSLLLKIAHYARNGKTDVIYKLLDKAPAIFKIEKDGIIKIPLILLRTKIDDEKIKKFGLKVSNKILEINYNQF